VLERGSLTGVVLCGRGGCVPWMWCGVAVGSPRTCNSLHASLPSHQSSRGDRIQSTRNTEYQKATYKSSRHRLTYPVVYQRRSSKSNYVRRPGPPPSAIVFERQDEHGRRVATHDGRRREPDAPRYCRNRTAKREIEVVAQIHLLLYGDRARHLPAQQVLWQSLAVPPPLRSPELLKICGGDYQAQ